MIRHLLRPSMLIALLASAVLGALVLVFRTPTGQGRPTPLPVAPGEVEIVWLYAATNASSWERFVAAVKRSAQRLQDEWPGLRIDVDTAFPRQTTAVPQVSLSWPASARRFVFRWYKLTSDWKASDWIEALLQRQPPPLAFIGGSSSDDAREVAGQLQRHAERLAEEDRPLLLLTTATADRVAPYLEGEVSRLSGVPTGETPVPPDTLLTQLYPRRTFRFGFSNRQMARTVCTFIWSRDDLRPDSDPAYLVKWDDDSYSRDLLDAFGEALRGMMAQSMAEQWAWLSGGIVNGGCPPLHTGSIFPADRLPPNPFDFSESGSLFCLSPPPASFVVASSAGSYDTPNRYEDKAARDLLDLLQGQQRPQTRPLLILTGQAQPSRRFLRALIRSVPDLATTRRFVVASGDAVSFNTVYRDRMTAWNIQDLPFPLVFFCHRNPIDAEAGFRRENAGASDHADDTAPTGTEDLLLFGDLVEALLQAAAPPCANAEELSRRLVDVRLLDDRIVTGSEGIRLFDANGQRCSGTGEHVVYLRPTLNDFRDRLLPKSTMEVWAWQRRDRRRGELGQHWQRRGQPLNVSYSEAARRGGEPHGEP